MTRRVALAACGAVLCVTTGCAPLLDVIGRPRVTRVRPRVTGIDFRRVTVAFDVDVDNPYPFALRAPILRYGLEIEGADFLKGEHPVDVHVPARREGTVTLPARVTYTKLWRTYRELRRANEVSYRLHGVLLVSALGQSRDLPLERSGTVPILHPPKFRHPRVGFSPVSWRGALVTLQADVHNPNVFPLGVHDLGYRLSLGDVEVANVTATTGGPIGPGQNGCVVLTGRITASGALLRLARGSKLGKPRLTASGVLHTPYGVVNLAADDHE